MRSLRQSNRGDHTRFDDNVSLAALGVIEANDLAASDEFVLQYPEQRTADDLGVAFRAIACGEPDNIAACLDALASFNVFMVCPDIPDNFRFASNFMFPPPVGPPSA